MRPCSAGDLVAGSFQRVRFCALLCIAGALFAQPDTQPTAEWIRSPEPLKQAWGAHVIAEQKLTALIPELLPILESPETSADADAARFAALDTLIQLNAEVPLSDLEPLVDRFPTDVLILASRSNQDASALLLKLLDRQHNSEVFVAVGNLLTPKRVAGFAKVAMKEFCQTARVYVYNADQPRGMGSGGSWATGGKTDPPRAGWPDTGSYQLAPGTADPARGWSLLADREHPISFIRTANKGYTDHGFDYSNRYNRGDSCVRAEEFLALYVETTPSELPIRTQANLEMNWTGEPAFEVAVRGFIAEQRAHFGSLAGQLAARGYLTSDEAFKVRLNLTLFLNDAREHDRTPLPDIGEWAKEPK